MVKKCCGEAPSLFTSQKKNILSDDGGPLRGLVGIMVWCNIVLLEKKKLVGGRFAA